MRSSLRLPGATAHSSQWPLEGSGAFPQHEAPGPRLWLQRRSQPGGSQVQGGDDDYAPQERNPLHPPPKPEVKNTLEDAEGRLDSQGPEQYTSPWLPTLYLRG